MKQSLKFNTSLLLVLFVCILGVNTSKAQVSYSRTVDYINESLKDLQGLARKYNDQYTYTLKDVGFGTYATDKNRLVIEFTRSFSDKTSDEIQVIFNPKHIVSIVKLSELPENGFHHLEVELTGPLALKIVSQTSNHKETSEKTFIIPYIAGDSKAFQRIKLALENLKSIALVRDSQDPFAN